MKQHSVFHPFNTRYGITSGAANSSPIWMEKGATKREAREHAQRIADLMRRTVFIVENDPGFPDYFTTVQPS